MLEFAAMNEFQLSWLLVYFFEAVLFFILYDSIMLKDPKMKYRNAGMALVLILGYVGSKYKMESYVLPNILVMILYGAAVLYLFTDIDRRNIFWMAGIFAVCVEFGRVMVYGCLYMSGNIDIYYRYSWLLRILVQLLKLGLVLFVRRTVCAYSRFRIRLTDEFLLLLAIVQLIFLHYRRRIHVANAAELGFEIQTFLLLGVGVILTMVALLNMIYGILKEAELKEIREAMADKYQKTRTQSEVDGEIRRIYHDLKHQLAALDSSVLTVSGEEREKLTDRLLEHVSELDVIHETGSTLLDSLLNHKKHDAVEKKIDMEIFLEEIDYGFISEMDLCSIVGNVLDNAIEAVQRLPEEERKWIRVKIAQLQGIWVLKAENSCMEKPRIEDGKYISSKLGPKRNGIGISSIRYCAEKYGGNVKIESADRVFTICVTVPVFP